MCVCIECVGTSKTKQVCDLIYVDGCDEPGKEATPPSSGKKCVTFKCVLHLLSKCRSSNKTKITCVAGYIIWYKLGLKKSELDPLWLKKREKFISTVDNKSCVNDQVLASSKY